MRITKDKFNSDYFGLQMGDLISESGSLSTEELREGISKAKAEGLQHVTVRIPDGETAFLNAALDEGFSVSDVLVEWQVDYTSAFIDDYSNNRFFVREATDGDIEDVRRIAASSIRCDRFHHDVNLPNEKCDEYYAIWAGNLCRDDNTAVYVVCEGSRLVGFAAIDSNTGDRDRLTLVAVDSRDRGQGAFGVLVREAIRSILRGKPDRKGMDVGTYIDNITMQRGLAKLGFSIKSSKHILYKMI